MSTEDVLKDVNNLYSSKEWMAATPAQRAAFRSKVVAIKRMQKEKAQEELGRKKREAPPLTKKQKRLKRQKKRSEQKALAAIPPKQVFVSGVSVDSKEFLLTYEWRKVRMMALKMHGPKCQCCGATPSGGAVMNVDHIKPRKGFPHLALEINNLQILCNECNHGKGNWDQTDWRPTRK